MANYICPTEASAQTREQFIREKDLWPIVSRYNTRRRVEKRLDELKSQVGTLRPGQQKTKLLNELHLLFVKKVILTKPKGLRDLETMVFAFIRFLWGHELATAETKEERKRAREEETVLLLEVWNWWKSHMQRS